MKTTMGMESDQSSLGDGVMRAKARNASRVSQDRKRQLSGRKSMKHETLALFSDSVGSPPLLLITYRRCDFFGHLR
jgi:hypothetical protein